MAQSAATPAPEAPTARTGGSFVKRELNGATFLTLEHVTHMVLVVIVTGLLAAGIMSAIALWSGDTGALATSAFGSLAMVGGAAAPYVEASMAIGIVAALLVLVPLLVVLDRRTRAEWHKRAGYAGRLAYKVPVYTALGALITVKTIAFISALSIVLSSLALIGVDGNGVGNMYLYEFLPAMLFVVLFSASAWYLFKLAKGRDLGRMYSMVVALLSVVLVVALFVTSVMVFHKKANNTQTYPSSSPSNTYDDQYYQDLLNKYYQ